MLDKEVIETLRNEVKTNPVSSDVLHLFALRKRARNTVTLSSLYQRMLKEGYKYQKSDYVHIIRVLAKTGFGKLDIDAKGRVKGLKDISVTLQSIGAIACGKADSPNRLKHKNKFTTLVNKPNVLKQHNLHEMLLKFPVNNKIIEIRLPEDVTTKDLIDIINRMNSTTDKR